MSPRERERRLVDECLATNPINPDAWAKLYDRLLQRAPGAIYRARQRYSVKGLAPADLATTVSSDLYLNRKKLAAFYKRTRSLDAFLDYLLLSAIRHQAQEEKRRRERQVPLSGIDVPDVRLAHLPADTLEELKRHLTPKENEYLEWYEKFLKEGARPCPFPASYATRLQDRIEKKARNLIYGL